MTTIFFNEIFNINANKCIDLLHIKYTISFSIFNVEEMLT